jgi:CheY-like chemotaxis protein
MHKILVVEDDLELLMTYRDLLEWEGYEVYTSKAALDAIHIAQRIIPDLLILDAYLICEPGALVLNHLKSHTQLKDTRTVVISGDSDLVRNDPRYREADAFFIKPFSVDKMLKTLLKLLEAR